jgi:hypothetical protein
MIKGRLTNPATRQTSAQTTPFINHQHLMTSLRKVIGRTKAGKARANNENIG